MSKNKSLETQKSYNPEGPSRPNRNMFKDCLARALLADDGKKLRKMCDQLLDMTCDVSLSAAERIAAMKLIIERVDGRPPQSIEVTDSSDKPSIGMFKITKVE